MARAFRDLRGNGGGDPRMVAHISSYLFAEPTHLNDLYNRKLEDQWGRDRGRTRH